MTELEKWKALADQACAELADVKTREGSYVRQITDLNWQLGKLKGQYDAAHLPGIVDGWRERAEAAEERLNDEEAVRAALMAIKACVEAIRHNHSDVEAWNKLDKILAVLVPSGPIIKS